MFTSETGGPLHVNTVMARFRRLIEAAGEPPRRFRGMCHNCATLLTDGVHPKIVQEGCGTATSR